ncbi:MAG: 4-hydroxy-tetrahydrodipicolinate reductase [Burkholderiales bacterium]|nr:4-hydroxy-tetrahydrodipicolinate reductase [Burkholderiales bacterium]
MINLALIGANGKMGLAITTLIAQQPKLYNLKTAIVNNLSSVTPILKETAKHITQDITQIANADVVIDFSTPSSNMQTLHQCLQDKIPLVIGTTGFNQDEHMQIKNASSKIPLLISPNMSLAVNMLFKLTEIAAKKLANFETEIVEAHHRHKKDAPSGTALALGNIIANARNIDFNQYATFTRHGITEKRTPNDIGFSVIRGGNINGSHDVLFLGDYETFTISAEVTNRSSYANGTLAAAIFLAAQPIGLYNMLDILDL